MVIRRRKLLKGLLSVALLWYGSVVGQGISVSPSRLFFMGEAGSRLTQTLTIANPSAKSMSFRLFLRDFVRDSLGEKIYSEPGSMAGSNATWVDGLPSVVILPPGGKQDIPVHLNIPSDTAISQRGVTRSMLFVSQTGNLDTVNAHKNERNMGIRIRLEAAIHIYYTPAHCVRRSLEFMAVDDRGVVDTVRRLAIRVRNDGEVSTDASLRMELTDKRTGREIAIPEHKISLLPGAIQIVYVDLPVLSPGTYLAVAFLDTGDQNDLKVAQKDILY